MHWFGQFFFFEFFHFFFFPFWENNQRIASIHNILMKTFAQVPIMKCEFQFWGSFLFFFFHFNSKIVFLFLRDARPRRAEILLQVACGRSQEVQGRGRREEFPARPHFPRLPQKQPEEPHEASQNLIQTFHHPLGGGIWKWAIRGQRGRERCVRGGRGESGRTGGSVRKEKEIRLQDALSELCFGDAGIKNFVSEWKFDPPFPFASFLFFFFFFEIIWIGIVLDTFSIWYKQSH